MATVIPILAFFTRIGLNVSFQNCYQAGYSNATVFPLAKRATAIGICNFIARLITACAPLVAEFKEPEPAGYLCAVTFTSFLVAFFLPSKGEEEELLEKLQTQKKPK